MQVAKLFLTCLCCLTLALASWGQSPKPAARSGILGYLDPQTGAFRPVPSGTELAPDPSTHTTFGGTITLTLTVTLKTTSISTVSCTANVEVLDDEDVSSRAYLESAGAAGTGSGATRTCTVSVPYSWVLATQGSDMMRISYFVFGNSSTLGISRNSQLSPLETIKVPANGAITAISAAVTL